MMRNYLISKEKAGYVTYSFLKVRIPTFFLKKRKASGNDWTDGRRFPARSEPKRVLSAAKRLSIGTSARGKES
jgi:hypothetical protein